MKRVLLILTILIVGISACENFENEFPDYRYTSGYFPYQYPVRTIILGDYIYDNSNDLDHKFRISVAMGGVYENTQDRSFSIQVDESLCNNLLFEEGGDPVLPLPSNYYTLSSTSEIVIPRGEYNGGVYVQLSDAFFNDPLSVSLNYVVPVRLVSSADVDTILAGAPSVATPDVRNSDHWDVDPKNFTLFGIKFINELHGVYFHHGQNTISDGGVQVEANTYSEQYLEFNPTSRLATTGKNQVKMNYFLRSEGAMTGQYEMILDFTDAGAITVSSDPAAPYTVTGTGQFQENQYEWGNKERNGMTLSFAIEDGTFTYTASDILVVRDRDVRMEVFSPFLN